MIRTSFFFILLIGLTAILSAQPANRSSLAISQIMQGEKFVGYLAEDIRWGTDSETIYFTWNPDGDTLRSASVSTAASSP